MNYQQFLTSMTGVGNTPPQMQQQQQQQQQHMSNVPQFQQQLPIHMQHQQQGQPHHHSQHQHQLQQIPQHQHQHQDQQPLHGMLSLSLPPHLHQQPAMVMGMPTLGPSPGPSQYSSLGFYTGFPEPLMYNAQKSQRHRRKSAPGVEHIKHRRTRSGCYTCRNRRIKCDEGRPTCERCKKGNRECVYPDPNSTKSAAAAAAAAAASGTSSTRDTPTPSQQASPDSSNEGDDDDMDQDHDNESKLGTIVDDDEATLTDTADATIKEDAGSSSYQFTTTINERPAPQLRHANSMPLKNLRRSNTGPAALGGSMGTARRPRQDSETPSLEGKCSSPATSTGTAGSFPLTHSIASSDAIYTPSGSALAPTPADWSHLPQEIRFFLGYFCDNITHFHYCVPIDYDSFVHSLLPSLAIRNESLLYAMVAFSSYHYMLRDPAANLQQFLKYYDQSVRLLLGTLKRKEPHNLGTLLTVLQLATIEEYLGDWINLMGHQKAALEMLTDMYTPDSIVQTPVGRAVLHWYSRFDVFVGMMGGFPTGLPRIWFTTLVDYYKECIATDPNNVVLRIEECSSSLRLISYEMSMLFARAKEDDDSGMGDEAAGCKSGSGGLASFPSFSPNETFIQEHARILNQLHEWKKTLDTIVTIDIDGEGASPEQHPFLVKDFSHATPPDESDIVDPYEPGQLYYGPLFGVTIMSCDWESIMVMHELQAAQLQIAMATMGAGAPEGGDAAAAQSKMEAKMSAELAGLAKRAYKICQMFEQLERWPASPPGSLIISQSKLAMATLFLPRDQRHHMWIRRKFALIETMGYIFPVTTRTRMAELFNDPSCVQWWLPDNEGFSPILQSVRAFADERNATVVSAQNENLREVRHVFGKLQIGEGKDREKDNDTQSEASQSTTVATEASSKGKGKGKGKGRSKSITEGKAAREPKKGQGQSAKGKGQGV